MNGFFIATLLSIAAFPAAAQEIERGIVTIATRPGVTQSFFVAGMGFALISVKGGKPPESNACEPLSPHGFYGKEAETVDAISAWMLKKPFAKEIE